MTQQTLENIIIKLKCCSANLADSIVTNLKHGGCDNTTQLILLNDFIDQLEVYTLNDTTQNCLDETDFNNIVVQSKNICDLCDCGTHT